MTSLWGESFRGNELQVFIGEEGTLQGEVATIPSFSNRSQRFTLSADQWNEKVFSKSFPIEVSLGLYPEIARGERLTLDCSLISSRHGTSCIYGRVNEQKRPDRNSLTALDFIRESYAATLIKVFPEPVAGFIRGLTIGGLTGLSEVWRERFRITGTTHLVALSGFNVTIITSLVLRLMSRLTVPRRWRLWLILIGLLIFNLMVGAQASLIRASLMGSILALAAHLGRPPTARTSLTLAATVMTLHDPFVLHDVGFQLSFLAIIGIFTILPVLETWAPPVKHLKFLRESFLLSVSAELCVLPLILSTFGTLSLVAPFTNAVVTLLIPYIMFFGFLGTVAGFISTAVGTTIGFTGYLLATTVLAFIRWTAALPMAAVFFEVSIWWVGLYYGALAFSLFFLKQKNNRLTSAGARLP